MGKIHKSIFKTKVKSVGLININTKEYKWSMPPAIASPVSLSEASCHSKSESDSRVVTEHLLKGYEHVPTRIS